MDYWIRGVDTAAVDCDEGVTSANHNDDTETGKKGHPFAERLNIGLVAYSVIASESPDHRPISSGGEIMLLSADGHDARRSGAGNQGSFSIE